MEDVERFVGVAGEPCDWLVLGCEEIQQWQIDGNEYATAVRKHEDVLGGKLQAEEQVEEIQAYEGQDDQALAVGRQFFVDDRNGPRLIHEPSFYAVQHDSHDPGLLRRLRGASWQQRLPLV